MTYSEETDTLLIKRFRNGDKRAFDDLLKRYEQSIYNFGLKMCRRPEDAEDLLQETFLNALRYLDRFRGEAAFKNWLFRIATSVCIKKRRKKKHEPELELSWEELLPDDHPQPEDRPMWLSTPIEQLLNQELRDILNGAIKQLPPKYKIVLVLRDIEQFSTKEVAGMLSIMPSTVKVRLHRARLFVRNRIKGYYEEMGHAA
ncbi:MAG: sigma-70 family RNA polymerase sigma factor [Deltaproteobacteria bacterium]|nr:sigma-70 family RNA polymerase sigma factor [Deltaproteobacteria bacterium]